MHHLLPRGESHSGASSSCSSAFPHAPPGRSGKPPISGVPTTSPGTVGHYPELQGPRASGSSRPLTAVTAPLVWLHSYDRYMPSDLLTHIQHTSPALDGRQIPDLPALDLDNLEILNPFGDEVALTSNDDPTTYPPWLLGASPDADGRIHNATPCVVILVEKGERDLDAFYFFFYSYNEGPNVTQVLEPFDRLVSGGKAASGMHFGDHIGDWSVVLILLPPTC